jgi:phospholipid transport system transporter-binding protein
MPRGSHGRENLQKSRMEIDAHGLVRLYGPLSFDSCARLYDQMSDHGAARLTRIDLSGVTSADSAGLALLLEWQAGNRDSGRRIEIRGVPQNLLRLAQLNGAIKLLDLSGRET